MPAAQTVTARTVSALHARPKASVALAVFLIVVGVTLGLAREAIADYTFGSNQDTGSRGFPRDSNGFVPERSGRLNPDSPPSSRTHHKLGNARALTNSVTGEVLVDITYDWREVDYCNILRDSTRSHERAHSRGWGHGYGTPQTNAAYYSTVTCFPDGSGGRDAGGGGEDAEL